MYMIIQEVLGHLVETTWSKVTWSSFLVERPFDRMYERSNGHKVEFLKPLKD